MRSGGRMDGIEYVRRHQCGGAGLVPGGFLLGVLVPPYSSQRVVNTAPLSTPGAIPNVDCLDQEDTASDTKPEIGRGAERPSAQRVSVHQERAKAPSGQNEWGYSWQHAVSFLQ